MAASLSDQNEALRAEVDRLREEVRTLRSTTAVAGREFRPQIAAVLEGLPVVLWAIDSSGRITVSEGRGLAALGLAPGQLVGADIFLVYADNPDALEPIRQCLKGELGSSVVDVGGASWENRYFPRFHDGEVVGLFGLSMDVSKLRDAEAARRRSDQRWRSLVASAPDDILIVDRDHTVSFVSRVDEPARAEDVLGTSLYERFDTEFHDAARQAIEAVFAGAARATYGSARTKSPGVRSWFESRVGPITEAGEVTGVVIVSTDITHRRQAELDKELLQAQVQHAQKLESLGVLAGGIAHDFNNLLVSMMGHGELAHLGLASNHESTPHIEEVLSAAHTAAELCQQMLTYAGKGQLELRKLDLSGLTGEIAQLLSVSIPKDIELELDLAADLWPVEVDAAQMRQVVLNLVTNASEAVGDRQGRVRVRTGHGFFDHETLLGFRVLEEALPGEYVFVEVADTGVGMSEETRTRMFDPFFTTKDSGRGLGMASVLGMVRGHGGALGVNTVPDEGTTIRVFLPRSPGEAAGEAQRAPSEPRDQTLGQGRTALVVDDEPGVRRVAVQLLSHLGFATLEAADGKQAVDLYEAHSGPIAMVLLDHTMPVMGGAQALSELRRLDPEVAVVLSSGYTDAFEPIDRTAVLRKPYRLTELREAVREALGMTDPT